MKKLLRGVSCEEVPQKREIGCLGRKRYLMNVGRTVCYFGFFYLMGWDVGREEEK